MLLHHYPQCTDMITFVTISAMGIPLAILTLSHSLAIFYALSFLLGLGSGGAWSAGGILIFQIWRDRGDDGDPFMHAVHFGVSLGTVVGPLVAAQALKVQDGKLGLILSMEYTYYCVILS